jgi:hypothetical protein
VFFFGQPIHSKKKRWNPVASSAMVPKPVNKISRDVLPSICLTRWILLRSCVIPRLIWSSSPSCRRIRISASEEITFAFLNPGSSSSSSTASGKKEGSLSLRPNITSSPRHHAIDSAARDLPKELRAVMTCRPGPKLSCPWKSPCSDLPDTLTETIWITSPPACRS